MRVLTCGRRTYEREELVRERRPDLAHRLEELVIVDVPAAVDVDLVKFNP